MEELSDKKPQILYNCYHSRSRTGEQFVPEHVLTFLVAGSSTFLNGSETFEAREGDFRLLRRNQLAKFIKQPPENGDYKSISIFLDQETLRAVATELNIKPASQETNKLPFILLKDHPLYKSYIASLWVYFDLPEAEQKEIMELKIKEIIRLLLMINPETKDILFDFSMPGKIDLAGFMEKNFQFNVSLDRFAHLTGRSLATFKRDFQKIFNEAPRQWLQQRRLKEAYYLLKEQHIPVADVYVEVGFENLSHFSYSFKKAFGYAPTEVLKA